MEQRTKTFLHLHGLMREHRRQMVAIVLTTAWLVFLFLSSLVFFPTEQYTEEPTFDGHIETPDLGAPLPAESQENSSIFSHVRPAHPAINASPTQPVIKTFAKEVTIKSGQSLALVFKQMGISSVELVNMEKVPEIKKNISKLNPGQVLTFEFLLGNKTFYSLSVPLNSSEDFVITKTDTGFTSTTLKHMMTTRTRTQSMLIQGSFSTSGNKAGIPMKVLASLTNIYSSKIDFTRNIKNGDKLVVQYEEITDPVTEKTTPGAVIAAKLITGKDTFYAFRYRNNYGRYNYYDQNGKSWEKAFMRNPVPGSRISSPFNPKRRHPILGIVRPHLGTDFAASYGTPIKATADGRISFIGRKGGYGRAIIINNGGGITTLYGHMSRFGANEQIGTAVKMGQTIGYVGTSGLSTAPHLHYEFRINKKYYNPMTVPLPDAASIPTSQRPIFRQFVEQSMNELNSVNE